MSHAPNKTGRPYSEMLTYKPLTNNAVRRKIPTKKRNKSNKELKSSSQITIARLYTGGTGTESMWRRYTGGTGTESMWRLYTGGTGTESMWGG